MKLDLHYGDDHTEKMEFLKQEERLYYNGLPKIKLEECKVFDLDNVINTNVPSEIDQLVSRDENCFE